MKECPFLQKSTKKLLSVSGSAGRSRRDSVLRETGKSFLLLFFKKEDSYFLSG
jgi:hypothetical protein